MMLRNKSFGESREDCSGVMVLDRRNSLTRRLDISKWSRVLADDRSWRDEAYNWMRSKR